MKNDPTGATGEASPVGSKEPTTGNVRRATSQVDDSSTLKAEGPAKGATSPSHGSHPTQKGSNAMNDSSTAAPAATPNWCHLANTYDHALRKVRALARNAEYLLSDNAAGSEGGQGSFSIPKDAFEEIEAMLAGIDAITERALEAA